MDLNHKVRTYKEYHSVCPSSELGLPPTPHPQASVPPPPCFWGEGNTRWRERGWESPNSDEGHTLWYSLYVRTLWPNHIQAGHKEDNFTHSISAKPQQRPKNRRLSPLLTNLVKNCCRFITGDLKAFFYIFCCDFLHIDYSYDFCFFAKGLKSEGERLKIEFCSSEMVKFGRGQHNYHCYSRRHRLQSFVMMKTTMYSDQ
jgi:hypothetical protein